METDSQDLAQQTQLIAAVGALNDALGPFSQYKLVAMDPKQIRLLDKNPHYMPKRVFDQLRSNIKKDGNLSSLPLLWKQGEVYECLSGNHRVSAAQDESLPIILCLYTDAELSLAEKRAIQLSHNSLIGKDDPNLLREVWMEIDDIASKIYSGLDENLLETLPAASPIQIKDAGLCFEELTLLFLPSEIERIEQVLTRLCKVGKRRFASRFEDWERFFDCLLGYKEAMGIVNTGVALLNMVEIVEGVLRERETSIRNEKSPLN
jgi:hypothetical protein